MKRINYFLILLTILLTFSSKGQLSTGFKAEEARDLIQMCNSFGYIDVYGDDSKIIPVGYEKLYTSPSYGMDNRFQVFIDNINKKGVLCFRGTTSNRLSWMANLYASMIPVKDKIVIDGTPFIYQLGEKKTSRIHAGYTLALYYLKEDLLRQIEKLNKREVYDIYIAGHSQGGALAQLVRAYLHYLPSSELDRKNSFKVYAFANPMVGNTSFTEEYNKNFVSTGMSFLIHNPDDFVPKLPYSENDSDFWKENLIDFLTNRDEFSTTSFMIGAVTQLFGDKIVETAKTMSKRIEKQLFDDLGKIEMPTLYDDFNYSHTGNIYTISPTVYPLELKDSTILKNDSLMCAYERDANGEFKDKSLYKKNNSFWLQHKPYNYYTAVLKDYFPSDYKNLKQKRFVSQK